MQGHELRAVRKGMGMTQGQLADALGFSHGFIGEMERGEKPIEKRTMLALHGLHAIATTPPPEALESAASAISKILAEDPMVGHAPRRIVEKMVEIGWRPTT